MKTPHCWSYAVSGNHSPARELCLALPGRHCPHDATAPPHVFAKGGEEPRPLDAGHHPPEGVRSDRHPALCPHLLQPAHEAIARVPPSLHRPTRVLHPLRTLHHPLRPTAHPLRHLVQPVLLHPPGQASSPGVARALRLERTGAAGDRRLRAERPSQVDRGTATRAARACWTLGGIGRPIRGAVLRAAETEVLLGRGERPGHGGGNAGCQTGLHCLAVVVAHLRHSITATPEDCCGLQGHRAAPSAVSRIGGHVIGDDPLVLRINRRLHIGADLGAASFPELQRTALWIR